MTLVASMINVAVTALYTEAIANGIRLKAWQEPQLLALQAQLKEIYLLPFVTEALREERAGMCSHMEDFLSGETNFWTTVKSERKRSIPRGWLYQNLATICALDQLAINTYDPVHDVVDLASLRHFESEFGEICAHSRPYTYFAAFVILNCNKAIQAVAQNQTLVNEAQIACALERYHLASGTYPASLDLLVPQFIPALPHDIIGGKPLNYKRTDAGKYQLFSVGWNETNDGGLVAYKKDGNIDLDNGDWVWLGSIP
jgi:hypothetical protein